MRRKEREITDIEKIKAIMDSCHCCRVGFSDKESVYILPLSFGYSTDNGITTLYFHSAQKGKKIDLINSCTSVGFEMDTDYTLKENEVPCDFSAKYKSIIGNGEISFINNIEEKKYGLQRIMYHNTKKENWVFDEKIINVTTVFKIKIKNITCKVHL